MHIIQELNPTPTQTSHCRNKITSVTAIADSTVSIFYLFTYFHNSLCGFPVVQWVRCWTEILRCHWFKHDWLAVPLGITGSCRLYWFLKDVYVMGVNEPRLWQQESFCLFKDLITIIAQGFTIAVN